MNKYDIRNFMREITRNMDGKAYKAALIPERQDVQSIVEWLRPKLPPRLGPEVVDDMSDTGLHRYYNPEEGK